MRSREPWSGCSSPAGICSNGLPAAQATIGPRLDLARILSRHGRRASPSASLALVVALAVRDTAPGPWRCRSPPCGSPRRRSRAGPAGRRSVAGQAAGLGRRRAGLAADRAAHLAVLRDLRDAGRSTCCRRTISRRTRCRRSPTAPRRPISACICCRWRPRAISAWMGTDRSGRAAGGDAGDHGPAWRGSAAISTTGTTRSDLRPLDPPYISTVDSGNLAGHLITLANACREWTRPCRRPTRGAWPASPTRSTWPAKRPTGSTTGGEPRP